MAAARFKDKYKRVDLRVFNMQQPDKGAGVDVNISVCEIKADVDCSRQKNEPFIVLKSVEG